MIQVDLQLPTYRDYSTPEWRYEQIGRRVDRRTKRNDLQTENRVLTVSNTQGFVLSDDYFDKQVYSRDISSYIVVRHGDFAYNPYRINVGSLAYSRDNKPGLVSPAYIVFHVVSDDLLPEYLFLVLKSDAWIASIRRLTMSRGSVRQVLSFADLQSTLIPLPPLPEQRRIAAVLNAIQEAIAAQEDVIAAARQFKRSLMQRLLVEELVDVERHTLTDCANVWTGGTPDTKTPEYWVGGTVEWVTAEDVSNTSEPFIKTTNRCITNSGLYASPAKMLPPLTTIVIARGATMGKVAVIPHSMAMNQTCYGFEAKPGVHPLYLYYALSLLRQEMLNISYGTIFTTITRGILNLITLPVPSEDFQERAVDALLAIDAKIAAEEDRKTALEALFKSMLHQLMTGQIRLLADEGLPLPKN